LGICNLPLVYFQLTPIPITIPLFLLVTSINQSSLRKEESKLK
ncbi:hypothetical protein Tco_0309000, partial [Tanacetum coccineum]